MRRQQSRRVLLAGVAGEPVRAGATLLLDDARVREVARRPEVDHGELLGASPHGVFVLRLGRDAVAPSGSWPERATALRELRDVGPLARIQVRLRATSTGPCRSWPPAAATPCCSRR
jgi:hypothetical protein